MESIFDDNFKHFKIGDRPDQYDYFKLEDKVADDGIIKYNLNRNFLNVDSHVFTKVWEPVISGAPTSFLDHTKLVVIRNQSISLDKDSLLVMEAEVDGMQNFGLLPSCYKDQISSLHSDFRIAGGAVNCLDLKPIDGDQPSNMVFDFIITNDTIWAVYERLPFGKRDFGGNQDYQSFTCAIPIYSRNDPKRFVKLSIIFDRSRSEVHFLVEDEVRLVIDNIGFPLEEYMIYNGGGIPTKVDLKRISFGFGTFSILDMTDPNDPYSKTGLLQLNKDDYYEKPYDFTSVSDDPSKRLRLFGNGFILRLKQMRAYKVY